MNPLHAARAILAAAFVAMILAACGAIQWTDQGVFIANIVEGRGLGYGALSHPLFMVAHRALWSVFGTAGIVYANVLWAALSAWMIVVLARRLGASELAALTVAVLFAWSHVVIWVATKFEVYLFHCAVFLAAWLLCDTGLRRRSLPLLFLSGAAFALAILAHQLTIVLAPVLAGLDRRTWQGWRPLVALKAGALAGLVPFALLYLCVARPDGVTPLEFITRFFAGGSATGSNRGSDVFQVSALFSAPVALAVVAFSFCSPLPLLAVAGWRRLREVGGISVLVTGCVGLVFALTYDVIDRFQFQVPAVALLCIAAAAGFDAIPRRWQVASLVLAPAGTLAIGVLALVISHLHLMTFDKLATPYRDDLVYFGAPFVPDRSAATFIERYDKLIPANALVACDYAICGAILDAIALGDAHFSDERLIRYPSAFGADDLAQECAKRAVATIWVPRLKTQSQRHKVADDAGALDSRFHAEAIGYSFDCGASSTDGGGAPHSDQANFVSRSSRDEVHGAT